MTAMPSLGERVNYALSRITGTLSKFLSNKDLNLTLLQQVDTLPTERLPELLRAAEETEEFFKIVEGHENKNLPDKFWKTPEGAAISRAYQRVYGDDLIDLPEAAMILRDLKSREEYKTNGSHRVYMNSLFKSTGTTPPKLRIYMAVGTQYPIRVRKSDVLRLKNEEDEKKRKRNKKQ